MENEGCCYRSVRGKRQQKRRPVWSDETLSAFGRSLRCDSFTPTVFFFRARCTAQPDLLTMAILGLEPSPTPTRPAHFDIERVIRPNILSLRPYRCARDDYSSGILLDANENALGHSIPASEDSTT